MPGQRGISAVELDGLLLRSHRARRGNGALLLRVPEIEDVFLAAVLEVGLAQEAVRAREHEQRQVGLFFHIRRVDQVLIDEQLGHAQREDAVGAGIDAEVQIGVDGAGVVVGRDADDLGAVVTGFVGKVRIGDAGLRNVRSPEHDVLRVEPVGALAGFGLHAPGQRLARRQVAVPVVEREKNAADVVCQARTGAETDRAHGRDDAEEGVGIRTVVVNVVEQFLGNHRERFVPGSAAPLAFAAFAGADERIAQPLRTVHVLGEAAALLAAARVVVGQVGIDARIVGGLLFPDHHAIAHVHLPRAGTSAVRGMRGTNDFVPGPDLAVEVLPAAIGIAAQRIKVSRQRAQAPASLCASNRAEPGWPPSWRRSG